MLLFVTSREHQIVIDWMAAECDLRGVPHAQLNTEEFPQQILITVKPCDKHLADTIQLAERQVPLAAIKGVWHYLPRACKPLPDLDPMHTKLVWQESETTLGGVYRALADRRWVNWPYNAQVAWYKAYQLRLAAQIGFKTPRTIITNHPDETLAFLHACGGQMVYKPMSPISLTDPSGLPSHQIFVTLITQADIEAHLDSIRVGPCMFQEFFPKKNDLTIYVIGERVWSTLIHSQDETIKHKVDYRKNWLRGCTYSPVLVPPQIEEMCLKMTRQMGLAMCNFDFALTPGDDYIFLDANPTDQWALIEDLVGFPLCAAIVDELLGVDTISDHPYIKERSLNFSPNTAIKNLAQKDAVP